MRLYDKNIKILEQYYPGMEENIRQAEKEQEQDVIIEELLSEDKQRILKVSRNGHCCYLGGKRNAKCPPHEWFLEQGELKKSYTYIFMGIGNINYLRELIEHVEVRLNIIIYEPSISIFLKVLEEIDLEKGMERHFILFWVEGIAGMSLEKVDTILPGIMKLENLKHLQLFILPGYDILFKEETDKLIEKCKNAALDNRVAYNTAMTFVMQNIYIMDIKRYSFFVQFQWMLQELSWQQVPL